MWHKHNGTVSYHCRSWASRRQAAGRSQHSHRRTAAARLQEVRNAVSTELGACCWSVHRQLGLAVHQESITRCAASAAAH
jgi:hypothetical protein